MRVILWRRYRYIFRRGRRLLLRYKGVDRSISYRAGVLRMIYRGKRIIIRRRPQLFIRRRWCRTRRYRGRTQVHIGRRWYATRYRPGGFLYRRKRTWRKITNKRRKGRRRRRLRRRKFRRYRRKLRRIRRYKRRMMRRLRRIRRYRRRTSPFKIFYQGKTRTVYKWRGRLTFRLGGRRRRIRFKYGKLYYRLRRAWRRIRDRKYRLFVYRLRKWRRVIQRGRKVFTRVGRRVTYIRITYNNIYYRRGRKWLRIRPRRRVRARWQWRRRFRIRRYGVMRAYVFRAWRTVYSRRGRFYFRYGRRAFYLSIKRGVAGYRRGRRWYRIPTRNLRVRLKRRYYPIRRVRKTLLVLYRRKMRPLRFIYGKVRYYFKRRWRRPSTRRGRRIRRRRRRRKLRRYWRRYRRRGLRRRRRYGRRNGMVFINYGKRFRRVYRKGRLLWFRVATKKYGLRIRRGRIYVRLRRWRPLRRLVRRLRIHIYNRWRWIYPRKGRFIVYYKQKGRPIRFRRGKAKIFVGRRWTGFVRKKTPVKLRLRYGGAWRYVVKRRRGWYIYYNGRYLRVTLRGRRFGIHIGGRWRYVPSRGGTLQIRYGRIWRRVRNCCNKLRAVLRGRLRRIRLRYGKARMRGRKGWMSLQKKVRGRFRLGRIRDQPLAQTSQQTADEQNAPNSIDPSTFTDTSATPPAYDSPPTAADQEAPSASITNEMSKETGATMDVNDYL